MDYSGSIMTLTPRLGEAIGVILVCVFLNEEPLCNWLGVMLLVSSGDALLLSSITIGGREARNF